MLKRSFLLAGMLIAGNEVVAEQACDMQAMKDFIDQRGVKKQYVSVEQMSEEFLRFVDPDFVMVDSGVESGRQQALQMYSELTQKDLDRWNAEDGMSVGEASVTPDGCHGQFNSESVSNGAKMVCKTDISYRDGGVKMVRSECDIVPLKVGPALD